MDKRSIVVVVTSLAGLIVLGVFLVLFFSRKEGEELDLKAKRPGQLGVTVGVSLKILGVRGDSSAAGRLRAGDRIVSIDGKRVSSAQDVVTALKSKSAGDLVQIGTNRGIVPVPLAQKPLRPSK